VATTAWAIIRERMAARVVPESVARREGRTPSDTRKRIELIIWLQGIWLPLHGYKFEDTPLWAGIYMLPLTVGFLILGPLSGYLSDRYGSRTFATGGCW
jgi:MFS family permease